MDSAEDGSAPGSSSTRSSWRSAGPGGGGRTRPCSPNCPAIRAVRRTLPASSPRPSRVCCSPRAQFDLAQGGRLRRLADVLPPGHALAARRGPDGQTCTVLTALDEHTGSSHTTMITRTSGFPAGEEHGRASQDQPRQDSYGDRLRRCRGRRPRGLFILWVSRRPVQVQHRPGHRRGSRLFSAG